MLTIDDQFIAMKLVETARHYSFEAMTEQGPKFTLKYLFVGIAYLLNDV